MNKFWFTLYYFNKIEKIHRIIGWWVKPTSLKVKLYKIFVQCLCKGFAGLILFGSFTWQESH